MGSKVIGQLHTGHDINGQSVLNTQGALPFNLLMGLIIFAPKTDHPVFPVLCARHRISHPLIQRPVNPVNRLI